jgi:DNA-directed RNA polymerase specialized sigma24 family protein
VIGASEFAFIEVAKEAVAARRPRGVEFSHPYALEAVIDPAPGTEEIVISRISSEQIVREAAELLSEREWEALRLVVTERYTYAEAAQVIFGSADFTKQVDGLLTRAKRKLNEAWPHMQPGTGASESTKVRDDMAEKEGSDE